MNKRKQWIIIILVGVLIFLLTPLDTYHQTVYYNDRLQVLDGDRGLIVEIFEPIDDYTTITDFTRYDHRSFSAALWGYDDTTGPTGRSRWRIVIPGCCMDHWWQFAMYVPSLWIDYGMFEQGELVIFFKPVPHGNFDLTHGYVWGHTFGWSNKSGWYCNYCEEK